MGEYDRTLEKIVHELNRAVPGGKPAASRIPESSASLDELLRFASVHNASDVLIIAGSPVALRVNGSLSPATGPQLSPEDTRALLLPLLDERRYEELQRYKSVDLCFVREAIGRFRANIHHQRGTLAASIRLLPARIPSPGIAPTLM